MPSNDLPFVRAAQETRYQRLQVRGTWLTSRLDDHGFVQEATSLLTDIHAHLCAGDLPADLVAAYWHLERQIRTQMLQRQVFPIRSVG